MTFSMVAMPVREIEADPGQSSARVNAGRCCVFVSSSDRGRDIFEVVFRNSETIWRDCDWPRYVGFTTSHPDLYGFKVVPAKTPADWRGEFGQQLDTLPDEIEYVMRMDEDALFMEPIDGARLNAIADLMARDDLVYVRLVPVTRNLPGRILEYFRRKYSDSPLRPIAFSEPYYSSVELVLWQRSYLRELLRQPGTIWEFEHIVTDKRHYAVWEPLVEQHQIVTRGKWNFVARRKLAQQGLSLAHSSREHQALRSVLRAIRRKLTFQVLGFLTFRIRRRLNRVPRN